VHTSSEYFFSVLRYFRIMMARTITSTLLARLAKQPIFVKAQRTNTLFFPHHFFSLLQKHKESSPQS